MEVLILDLEKYHDGFSFCEHSADPHYRLEIRNFQWQTTCLRTIRTRTKTNTVNHGVFNAKTPSPRLENVEDWKAALTITGVLQCRVYAVTYSYSYILLCLVHLIMPRP